MMSRGMCSLFVPEVHHLFGLNEVSTDQLSEIRHSHELEQNCICKHTSLGALGLAEAQRFQCARLYTPWMA